MPKHTEELPKWNPDNDLSNAQIIMKYQLLFTKYFGPDWAYGVSEIVWRDRDNQISIVARVRPAYQSTKGKTSTFKVDPTKFAVWRKNVKLYSFISDKLK